MSAPLDELVVAAAEALDAASGGNAVCTFTRAGAPVPGIKYAEGRWAALREVQRTVAAGAPLGDAVARVARGWADALAALRSRGAGTDWIAYRSGGSDALGDLLQRSGADMAP